MLRPMGSIFFKAATISDVWTEYRSPRFFFFVRSVSEPPPCEQAQQQTKGIHGTPLNFTGCNTLGKRPY